MIRGPTNPTNAPTIVRTFLTPSGRLLNPSNNLFTAPSTVVNTCKNPSPTPARLALKVSICLWNLPDADSVKIDNSRSAICANSAVDDPISSITCSVWLPAFPKLSNNADIRANWNFPKSCSIALALDRGSRLFNSSFNAITVLTKSPAFALTIPSIFTPNEFNTSVVFCAGLIIDARPDLSALADSEALIPPSRIAVRNKAKSFTSPPSCLTTGPALGIAITRS